MQPTHLRHGCDEMINRFGDTCTGLVRWAFSTGPYIRRMIDLKNILTKSGQGPLPKHSVAALIEEMFAVLCKGLIKLLGSHLPHPFHSILPFLTEFEAGRSLVQGGKPAADHLLDFGARKHPHAGLHDQSFVEEAPFVSD
jgi:hypothetical protein